MRINSRIATAIALIIISNSAYSETSDERRIRILTETKVNAVTDLSIPASEFKDDGDPNTIEIVFLTNKQDGPSRVTDDGEVIFLYNASEKTQEKLIGKAFEIRLARADSGT